MPSIASSFLHV